MVQELAHRVYSFLARRTARHNYAFSALREGTEVCQRSMRDRDAEFLSGSRRVGEISAQSNFLAVCRGRWDEQFSMPEKRGWRGKRLAVRFRRSAAGILRYTASLRAGARPTCQGYDRWAEPDRFGS